MQIGKQGRLAKNCKFASRALRAFIAIWQAMPQGPLLQNRFPALVGEAPNPLEQIFDLRLYQNFLSLIIKC